MQRSEDITELAKALAKAQAKIKHASKDNVNPAFKSRYADLASVFDAIKEPFAENGLCLLQPLSNEDDKVKCTTIVLHVSGQFISSNMTMKPTQATPQAMGSAATYLRRYMAMAIAGVAPDDDDGNEASRGISYAPSYSQSESKKAIGSAPAQRPVADAKPKAVSDTAASSQVKWSKHNAGHQKQVAEFLRGKNQAGLWTHLIERLDGKAYSQTTLREEWSAIDPERPDKEPE